MALYGGCYCGAVRYESTEQVFHGTTCHCASCRRISGAASVAWFSVAQTDYKLTAGTPARFRSSEHVTRTFCRRCGTHLTYQHDDSPFDVDVTICSLDEPERVAPEDHTFTRYRLSWDKCPDGLPEYQGSRAQG